MTRTTNRCTSNLRRTQIDVPIVDRLLRRMLTIWTRKPRAGVYGRMAKQLKLSERVYVDRSGVSFELCIWTKLRLRRREPTAVGEDLDGGQRLKTPCRWAQTH